MEVDTETDVEVDHANEEGVDRYHEILLVPCPDAVVDKGTVVIESFDAMVTETTVRSQGFPQNNAGIAEPVHIDGCRFGAMVFFVFFVLAFGFGFHFSLDRLGVSGLLIFKVRVSQQHAGVAQTGSVVVVAKNGENNVSSVVEVRVTFGIDVRADMGRPGPDRTPECEVTSNEYL
jgi:hypothetical protein